ncbi:MAG TPA: PfkB family carbohydrate kinase [Candidatus Eremiobacteraeota bacterium]|nr:MAG: 5-dehydro-2-deoxygluconokinase [bacterium ADurb.Bin363]HPZ08970.1 PfkB family carbohydrate kinase [Candidatus Eremiobacteraeota bacterium]
MLNTSKFDVIGIGGAAWDFLGIIKKYPGTGEKTEMSFIDQQGGGQTGTAIVTVARLGGKASIIGVVGDDEFGEKIRKSFLEEGVDISHLFIDKSSTSHIAFCMTLEDTGDRTIFYNRGTKRFLTPQDIDRDFVSNCRCLLIDTHHSKASLEAVSIARSLQIPVVTDIERFSPENDSLFALGTHHILPERYLLEYTKESSLEKALLFWRKRFKESILVITLGERGTIAFNGEEIITQKAYKIDSLVDTTGAGDVFHGAFAYGLTLGYDLPTNLNFASIVAGLKCRFMGGRKGIPTVEEVRKYFFGA